MDIDLHLPRNMCICSRYAVADNLPPTFQPISPISPKPKSSIPFPNRKAYISRMKSLNVLIILALSTIHARDITLGVTPRSRAEPDHKCPAISLNECCSAAGRAFDHAIFANTRRYDVLETFRWQRATGACEGPLLERVRVVYEYNIPITLRSHGRFMSGARIVREFDIGNLTAVDLEEGNVTFTESQDSATA